MEAGQLPTEEEIPAVVERGREGKENEICQKSMTVVVKAGAQGAK